MYYRLRNKRHEAGFSILEMLIASVILMCGIISVVELVPASLQSTVSNRMDTMATAIAQRELDQMLAQPLTLPVPPNPNAYTFLDANGNSVSLGGPSAPGANVVMNGPSAMIDFSQNISSVPSGFFISNYIDPYDPTRSTFELRWAVYAQTDATGNVLGKRIIIGCRRVGDVGDAQLLLPVTLDTSIQK